MGDILHCACLSFGDLPLVLLEDAGEWIRRSYEGVSVAIDGQTIELRSVTSTALELEAIGYAAVATIRLAHSKPSVGSLDRLLA